MDTDAARLGLAERLGRALALAAIAASLSQSVMLMPDMGSKRMREANARAHGPW